MADEVDYAQRMTALEFEAVRSAILGTATHAWTILFIADGVIVSASFTGGGSPCVNYMEEMLGIDLLNGRWARGHSVESVKASDEEMEEALLYHFAG